MNLSGKIALVTGASRGIGESLAIGLADHGTDVIICDLESESKGLANTHKQIEKTGKKCWSYFLDVTKKSQIQKMVSDILNDIGSIDILVNNAGILTPTSLEDIDEETWDSHFEVNTKGVLLMCQSVLPHMREKKFGRIINIASIAGRQGSPTQGHYASTKSAVITLTRVLAQEVGEAGITVNAICPGIILTEMGKNNLGSEKEIAHWSNVAALKRLGDPKDIIGPTLFFASNLYFISPIYFFLPFVSKIHCYTVHSKSNC